MQCICGGGLCFEGNYIEFIFILLVGVVTEYLGVAIYE